MRGRQRGSSHQKHAHLNSEFFDTTDEDVCHVFMLGTMVAATTETMAKIKSISQSDDGYCALIVCDDKKDVAVIIEYKKSDSESRSAWKNLSMEALRQIDRHYNDCDLLKRYDAVRKYGLTFHGKRCMTLPKECRRETERSSV